VKHLLLSTSRMAVTSCTLVTPQHCDINLDMKSLGGPFFISLHSADNRPFACSPSGNNTGSSSDCKDWSACLDIVCPSAFRNVRISLNDYPTNIPSSSSFATIYLLRVDFQVLLWFSLNMTSVNCKQGTLQNLPDLPLSRGISRSPTLATQKK